MAGGWVDSGNPPPNIPSALGGFPRAGSGVPGESSGGGRIGVASPVRGGGPEAEGGCTTRDRVTREIEEEPGGWNSLAQRRDTLARPLSQLAERYKFGESRLPRWEGSDGRRRRYRCSFGAKVQRGCLGRKE